MLLKKRRRLPIDRYYFLRRIDELGRIVIPIEIRKELKIAKGDIINISIAKKSFSYKIDAIGRVIVPMEIRKELDIKAADKLKVYIENGNIVLENKYII